jgi:hypothetical protein
MEGLHGLRCMKTAGTPEQEAPAVFMGRSDVPG